CELIRFFGFACQTTEATTDDGYILEVDRVGLLVQGNTGSSTVNTTNRHPIILVPPILSESGVWFLNYPSQSPGFLLAQRGYDVWAMNTREIAFRSRHKTLSQKDDRFDEIGRYDIAAVIDLVLNVTGATKVTLLAFSQGMTGSLVLLSTRPEYNDKIDLLVAYGPVANITHIGYPVRELIAVSDPLFLLLDPLGDSGYLYLPEAPRAVTQFVCGIRILQGQPCDLLLLVTLLSSPEEVNKCELIRFFGFSCETYEATTDDGYIIEVDRAGQTTQDNGTSSTENGTNRNPILLVPGILSDSGSWFINYPSQSA
ncbi:hypothetical protein MTO96_041283, partial [Rhipicephalus appendiculatus]